jgi:hypothetical protein
LKLVHSAFLGTLGSYCQAASSQTRQAGPLVAAYSVLSSRSCGSCVSEHTWAYSAANWACSALKFVFGGEKCPVLPFKTPISSHFP